MGKFNFNKMRCKKLHWMREAVWEWYMPLIDAFKQLQPKHAVASGDCNVQKQNLMGAKYSEDQEPQGPPNYLWKKIMGGSLNTNIIDHYSSLSGLELMRHVRKKFGADDQLTRVQNNY